MIKFIKELFFGSVENVVGWICLVLGFVTAEKGFAIMAAVYFCTHSVIEAIKEHSIYNALARLLDAPKNTENRDE